MVKEKLGDFRAFIKPDGYYLFVAGKVALFNVSERVYEVALWWESGKDSVELSKLHSKYSVAEVDKALEQLEQMADEGHKGSELYDSEKPGFKEMHLQVIHDCNLDCRYCYAGGGTFGGKAKKMDISVAEKAVDFFIDNLRPNTTGDLNFDGGEPLMNWSLIEHCVNYTEKRLKNSDKKVEFNISTNGTLLNKSKREFVEKKGIGLGVSVDGDEETHNANRPLNGSGSYRFIADNIDELNQKVKLFKLQGRATVTRDNLNCLETVKHLLEMGFKHIYLEPVSGDCDPWILNDQEMGIIKEQFSLIGDFYIKMVLDGDFFIMRNFYIFLQRIHRRKKIVHKCGVGKSGIAVTPDGDIFPCYKFSSLPEYRMGNVMEGGIDPDMYNKFLSLNVSDREACKECWAKYICGGGCLYLSVFKNSDIKVNDRQECDFVKHMCEISLKIYTEVENQNPGLWSRLL